MRTRLLAFLLVVLSLPAWPGAGARAQEGDPTRSAAEARVSALEDRFEALYDAAKYAEARAPAEEALALAEQKLGPGHPTTAFALNNLAVVLDELGDLPSARRLHERALAIREKVFGPAHEATAASLNNLAALLQRLGDLGAARPLFERALAITETRSGPDSADTARALGNLGNLLRDLGDDRAARPIIERSLAIREKALGPDHAETSYSLLALGLLLCENGDPAAARPLLARAVTIRERSFGPGHPATAAALNNFAIAFQEFGDLPQARRLHERALSIREKTLGPTHPSTANSLNNLAAVLVELGDVAAARTLHERALAVREAALGPDHPDTARSLVNLGMTLDALGDFSGAKGLLERALALQEKALGPEHPETVGVLHNLGSVRWHAGDLRAARAVLEKALALREKALGAAHPLTARSSANLGNLLRDLGETRAARPLLEKALELHEHALGPDHPDTATSAANLAMLLFQLGEEAEARRFLARAWSSQRAVMHALLPCLSSTERCSMLRARAVELGNYLRAFEADPGRTYAAALAWKGAGLRATAAMLRLPAGSSEEARRVAGELRAARRQLARLFLEAPGARPDGQGTAQAGEQARRAVDELERKLAGLLPDFAARAFLDVGPEDVARALPPGAVLLELLENDGEVFAWLVRPGAGVRAFRLGPARELEALADSFRSALERDDHAAWAETGWSLRKKLAAPLAAAFEAPGALYFSPDGALATIPLGLLPDGDAASDKYLMEARSVVCVTSGAGLVKATLAPRPTSACGLFVLGGVDYERAEGAAEGAADGAVSGSAGGSRRAEFAVAALPGTASEAEDVARRFRARFAGTPVRALAGREATEAAFAREATRARFVHAATHGFFDLPHLRRTVAAGGVAGTGAGGGAGATTRGFSGPLLAGGPPFEAARTAGAPAAAVSWNPLLFSGVVLAGANTQDGGSGEDGRLTAEEAQGLDLSGVDLLVLSACETGRGELAAGEGVLGLSRALSVAGARAFVLSLWRVPDAETRELMDAFYEGLWGETPLPPEEALRRAQLRLLARDRAGGAFRPSSWGAWTVLR
ncbi:MAG: CHAT domain-containing protein [Planctomycetes bacterium]|nr:CHAT domain-containing protein [Planctomycetota bacterium]